MKKHPKRDFLESRLEAIQAYMESYKRFMPWVLGVLSFVALLGATLYGAIHASYQISNNSDYLIYPYLFKHFKFHDLILATGHSNIFMFPLYILQALLPYNYTTLTLVNVGLILATVFWWVYLLVKVFGRKYFAIICAVMACIVFGSHGLVYNLAGDTIRNIEYPLSLAFILLVNDVLKGRQFSRRSLVLNSVLAIFFAAAIAGDSLLLTAIVLPLLLALFIYWLQTGRLTRAVLNAGGVVLVTVVFAFVIKKAAIITGIIGGYYFDPNFQAHTIPVGQLSISLTATLKEMLAVNNAYIFSLARLTPSIVIVFVNFAIFTLATFGIFVGVKRANADYRQGAKATENANFILLTLGLGFIAVPAAYIMLGQAVEVLPGGKLAAADTMRYLTLIPFLSIVGFVYLVKQYYSQHRALLAAIPIGIFVVMAVSFGHVRVEQNTNATQAAGNMRTSVNAVIAVAKQNHVSVVLSGYWYAVPIRFYSQDTIQTASVGTCGEKAQPPVNTRLSLYTSNPSIHRSALLIDSVGDDYVVGTCPSLKASPIFGAPDKVVQLTGASAKGGTRLPAQDGLQLWIYNYDIRSRVYTADLKKLVD